MSQSLPPLTWSQRWQRLQWRFVSLCNWKNIKASRRLFPNVPKRLTNRVSALYAVLGARDENKYAGAAFCIINEYLGFTFADPKTDKFLQVRDMNAAGEFAVLTQRVLLVGETLFALRSCVGFSEFCERLKKRDFRATFYELYCAKILLQEGFEVFGRPIFGVRGKDFDFHAIRNGQQVNVEVTCLTNDTYSTTTLLNALKTKRKQVPKDNPAIVFCVLPDSWSKGDPSIWQWPVSAICWKFLRTSTRRISAIVVLFAYDLGPNEAGSGGGYIVCSQGYLNKNPYFRIKDDAFLVDSRGMQWPPRREVLAGLPNNRYREESEFFRWVDCILPK